MACPFGLRVLFLLLVMAGLLESHAWARPVFLEGPQGYWSSHTECVKQHNWMSYLYPCPEPTTKEKELMEKASREWVLRWKAKKKKAEQARNLTVNIRQIDKTRITINVQVTNNSTMPVTFLNVSTPLDSDAFGRGLFHITPDSLPMVNFGSRVLPPRHRSPTNETYVEISPGMTISNTVTILAEEPMPKEMWARMLDVADRVEVQMKGKWHGIWAEQGKKR